MRLLIMEKQRQEFVAEWERHARQLGGFRSLDEYLQCGITEGCDECGGPVDKVIQFPTVVDHGECVSICRDCLLAAIRKLDE
jgi:hypothetical protein